MLINALFERIKVETLKLTPLIKRTDNITTAKTVNAINENAVVNIKVFKTRFSLDL